MPSIGVIDDRPDVRSNVKARLDRALRQEDATDWEVIVSVPLDSLDLYAPWVEEHEVATLLVDQRLNEDRQMLTEYTGHDIVDRLRPRQFDLPIFYLTEIQHDPVLESDQRVSGIIARSELVADIERTREWVRIFMREGSRYAQGIARTLARLSEISEKIVSRTATDEELTEAAAIRAELELPFEGGDRNAERAKETRADMLDAFEAEIQRLEELASDLRRIVSDAEDGSS